MRLAENTGRKKSRQKSPSGHHRTTLSVELWPTNGWDRFGSSGRPS